MEEKFFDLQPTLTGNSIYLRPLQIEDAEGLFKVASDPLIWEQHPSPMRYERAVFDAIASFQLGKAILVSQQVASWV